MRLMALTPCARRYDLEYGGQAFDLTFKGKVKSLAVIPKVQPVEGAYCTWSTKNGSFSPPGLFQNITSLTIFHSTSHSDLTDDDSTGEHKRSLVSVKTLS